jgi:hypothetical protein
MNYNIVAYIIYLAMTIFIIVYVGRLFYINGRVFILALFKGDAELTDNVNNILLIAYYLFNIGYAFITLRHWSQISNLQTLISSVSGNVGILVLILATTHYMNMGLIYYLSRIKFLTNTAKSFQS